MNLTRRVFVSGCLAGTAALSTSRVTLAKSDLEEVKLTTVSDGNLILPGEFVFKPMPQDQLSGILSEFDVSQDRLTPECNLALYQDGESTVLFDVGSGPDFMPSAGTILDSLEAVGIAPEDVTHVVFTHAHPDHIWGLLDDFDEPVFAQASYMIGRAEWDYWWSPATVNEIGEARAAFAVGAKRRLEAIEEAVKFFDDGDEVLPGIAAVSTPGHTPGHMSFEVRQGSHSTMILGDAIGNHHVAFRRPKWPSGSDQDAETAIKSRQILLDRITAEKMQIVGFHLPGGGIGHAEKSNDGYRFIGERN